MQEGNELLQSDKPVTIELGGKGYELSPVNLNVLADIEQELNCSIDNLGEAFDKRKATTLRALVWLFLKDKNPELTKEWVGQNVDLDNIEAVSNTIMEIVSKSAKV